MKQRFLVSFLSVAVLAAVLAMTVQSPAEKEAEKKEQTIAVRGDVSKEGVVSTEALEGLGAEEFEWKHKDRTYHFTGVPLEKVLVRFGLGEGVMSNEMPRREKLAGLKKVIVASSPDGFQAVFSYAELSTFNGNPTKAYVAWKLDGKPLPEEMGAFRIVVLSDKEGARSLYQLAALQVVDMREIVKPLEPKK
ncbi:molybdopterin-dependent oxidoreductase [Candidatus Sumerlaeota bacterium]|nr:molybdopterin-dependent oxidoreductase [Candidatus Sumerlaeota bacterium]